MSYAADVENRIRESVHHTYSVTAHPATGEPFSMEVAHDSGAEVTFSEDWSPHIQGSLTIKASASVAELGRLDPRTRCRLTVNAGYVYPGGVADVQELVNVGLRTRSVIRPDNTIELTFASDEARLQDFKEIVGNQPPLTGINECVSWFIEHGMNPDPVTIVSDFGPLTFPDYLVGLKVEIGDDFWSHLDEIQSRCGVWIYCGGDRVWRITKRAALTGTTSHKLKTGPGGTIKTARSYLDREGWSNAVVLKYEWNDGQDRVIYGKATIPDGPLGISECGVKTFYEERTGPIAQWQADGVAGNVLRNLSTRGTALTVEAVAAYWLRPGHTTTTQLPLGPQERQLVKSVQFGLSAGSMIVRTRQPEDSTIQLGA